MMICGQVVCCLQTEIVHSKFISARLPSLIVMQADDYSHFPESHAGAGLDIRISGAYTPDYSLITR